MSTATEAWLDVMPAIPLARGVPVVPIRTAAGPAVVTRTRGDGLVVLADLAVDQDYHPAARWRVDLSDPQGFGYAGAYFVSQDRWPALMRAMDSTLGYAHRSAHTWLSDRLLNPTRVTDADRLALARAIAEVV